MYVIPIVNELRRLSESTETLAFLLLCCLGFQLLGVTVFAAKLFGRALSKLGHLSSRHFASAPSLKAPEALEPEREHPGPSVVSLSPEPQMELRAALSTGRQLDFSGIETVEPGADASLPSTPDSAASSSPDDDEVPIDGKGTRDEPLRPETALKKASPSTPELSPSTTGEGEDDDRPPTGNPSSGSGDRRWPYLSYTPSQHRRTPPSPPTPTFSPDASPAAQPVDNRNGILTTEAVKEVIDLLSSDDEGGDDIKPQEPTGATSAIRGPGTSANGGTAIAAPPTGRPHELPEQQQQQQGAPSVTRLQPTAPPAHNQPSSLTAAATPRAHKAKEPSPLADPKSFWASFQPPRLSLASGLGSPSSSLRVPRSELVGNPPEAALEQAHPAASAASLYRLQRPQEDEAASDPATPPPPSPSEGRDDAQAGRADSSDESPLLSTARRPSARPRTAAVILVEDSSDDERDATAASTDPFEFVVGESGSPPAALSLSSRVTTMPARGGTAGKPRGAKQQRQQREPLGALTPSNSLKPAMTPAAFKKKRPDLVKALFAEFNSAVFGGRLPADLAITWSATLTTTAGVTHYSRKPASDPNDFLAPPVYSARIELSSKVLDTEERLRSTLCHELCHAAAWLLDHTAKPPHGPVFKKWAAKAMESYPGLSVTTCHQYKIHYPFRWRCTNPECGREYGRHSNSIDVSRQRCGECRGTLEHLGRFKPDGTPAAKRKASAFSLFVAANFAAAKAELTKDGGLISHAYVMRRLSEMWREQQQREEPPPREPGPDLDALVSSAAALALPASPAGSVEIID